MTGMIDKLYSVQDLLDYEVLPKKKPFREQTTECLRTSSNPLEYDISPAGLVWAFTVYLEYPTEDDWWWYVEYGKDNVFKSGNEKYKGNTIYRIELVNKNERADLHSILLNTAILFKARMHISPHTTPISGITVDRIIPVRV